MGIRRGKRPRLEAARGVKTESLVSLGEHDINYSKFDQELIWDKVNKRLDKQQDKIFSS